MRKLSDIGFVDVQLCGGRLALPRSACQTKIRSTVVPTVPMAAAATRSAEVFLDTGGLEL